MASKPSHHPETQDEPAPFGSIDRRAANRDAARDHVVTDARVGCQKDLRTLDFTRRVPAAVQQRRQLCSLRLAQIDPVSYVPCLSG